MADEVNLGFAVPGAPDGVRTAWRADPPAWLGHHGYRLVDESYESLVYEADATSGATRVMMFFSTKTIYRLTFTFRDDGAARTRVTLLGQAREPVRREILAWAEERAAR